MWASPQMKITSFSKKSATWSSQGYYNPDLGVLARSEN